MIFDSPLAGASLLKRLTQGQELVLASLLRVELMDTGLLVSFHDEKLREINERHIFSLRWEAPEDCRPSHLLLGELLALLEKLAKLMARLNLAKFAKQLDYSIIVYYTAGASQWAALALLRAKPMNALQKLLMLNSFFNTQPDMTIEQLLFYASRKLPSYASIFTTLEKRELHRLLTLAEYGLFGAEADSLLWRWIPIYHPDGSRNARGNDFQQFRLLHDCLRFMRLRSKLCTWKEFQKLTPEQLPLTHILPRDMPTQSFSAAGEITKLLQLPEADFLLLDDLLACLKIQTSFPPELYGYLLKTYGSSANRKRVPVFSEYPNTAISSHPLASYLTQEEQVALKAYCSLDNSFSRVMNLNSNLLGLILFAWHKLPRPRFEEFFTFLRRNSETTTSNDGVHYYMLSNYNNYPVASYLWAMEQNPTIAFSLLMELAPRSDHG